jgi:gamma-glutamylcyclotransferase (GGCT)/AIG2-like uncharacterized protein YtfP
MTTQYPVLTYGTLRPGNHNYVLLDGYTTYEVDVDVEGFNMYVFSGYPYVIDGEDTIKATLNFVHADVYDDVMYDLDMLEGFLGEGNPFNHYDRILVDVDFADTTIKAWMYVARDAVTVARVKDQLRYWPFGDWNLYKSVLV